MIKLKGLLTEETVPLPKPGDYVWVRWNDTMQWQSGIYIGKEAKGFKVYKFHRKEPKYIDYFGQLTVTDPHRTGVHIFKIPNFK